MALFLRTGGLIFLRLLATLILYLALALYSHLAQPCLLPTANKYHTLGYLGCAWVVLCATLRNGDRGSVLPDFAYIAIGILGGLGLFGIGTFCFFIRGRRRWAKYCFLKLISLFFQITKERRNIRNHAQVQLPVRHELTSPLHFFIPEHPAVNLDTREAIIRSIQN